MELMILDKGFEFDTHTWPGRMYNFIKLWPESNYSKSGALLMCVLEEYAFTRIVVSMSDNRV